MSEEEYDGADKSDSCYIQQYLFEPDADDSEIEDDLTESLVTADRLSSK